MKTANLIQVVLFSLFLVLASAASSQAKMMTIHPQEGEGWVQITERYKLKQDWREVRKLNWDRIKNHKRPNLIYADQELIIPIEEKVVLEQKPQQPSAPTANSTSQKYATGAYVVPIILALVFTSVALLSFVAFLKFYKAAPNFKKTILTSLFEFNRYPLRFFLDFQGWIEKSLERYDSLNKDAYSLDIPTFVDKPFVGYDPDRNNFFIRSKDGFFSGPMEMVAKVATVVCEGENCLCLANDLTELQLEQYKELVTKYQT